MKTTKLSPQGRAAEMEARQREAMRQEDVALEATRAKTERLRALRLEKEHAAEHSEPMAGQKPSSKIKR